MALKIGTNFGNNYEAARSILSTRQLFNQEDWEYNAINGNLDAYIDAVYDTDATTVDKLNSEYNYEYADSKTRTWALLNEKYGDKTVEQTDKYLRTRYKKDENGNYVLANGKPQEETYYASDYDYYKEIIKEHNDENQQLYLRKLEQQAKDEIHPIAKFFASLTAELGEVVSGTWSTIENIPVSMNALVYATIDSIKGKDWATSYVSYVGDDDNYIAGSKHLEYLLSEFERKYTTIRDIDGNLTSEGGFFVGLANSTGQMIPALLTSVAVGGIGSAAGLSTKGTKLIAQASSSAVFYGSMAIDNIHDTYQYFKQQGISVSSSAIIGNAVLKSAVQLIVELGLGKLTGHFSQLDSLVFGRSTGAAASKTASSLGQSLLNRVLGDFVQEGMEEVLQDTSDWLIDKVFSMLDQNFGELTDISAESLALSFLAGGIMSLSGHAVGIAKRALENIHAENVAKHNLKVESTGKGKLWNEVNPNPLIGIDEKTGKAKRLNSILSYEYGLNMQAFITNIAEIFEMSKTAKLINKESKEYKAYESAVAEAYIAYRMISSIYHTDPSGFSKANEILTEVQNMLQRGAFDNKLLSDKMQSLVGETLYGIHTDRTAVINKLKEAAISRAKGVYNKDTPITDASLDEKTRDALEELVTNGNVDRVVVTEDGKHLVIADNVVFVQLKQLQNGGADSIYESMAEETLANALIDGEYRGVGIKEVTAVYREVSGRPDASEHEAALSLFLNDSFFRIMLSTANKDTYQLLTSLIDIEQKVVPDKQRTTKYKQKLNQVINNMHKALYEYLLYQSNADYNISILSQEEKNRIRQIRWCKNLYRRVISKTAYKKLTDDDWKVLTNRVNAMPSDSETKARLLANLKSDNAFTRMQAMNAIAARYKNIFTSMYDGKTYMPDNSTPNRLFNTYLQQNGLTIETLRSENVSDDVKSTVTEAFGEFNIDNLIKFYQAKFGTTCNNAFTFTIDDNGVVSIYETKSKIQVGFSEYKAAYDNNELTYNIAGATNIERIGKRHDALSKLLHPNLSAATAAYTTIDDVIVNPSLLSDDVKRKIVDNYGVVDTETTFRYLQDYFITTTKNTTVIVLQDGTYAFGNIRPMKKLLRNPDRVIKADDTITIKSLISERYLYGRLADISITKVTDKSSKRLQENMKGSIAAYNVASNTIYLNAKLFTNSSQELIKFAILHEFQHAMQYENGMNLGLNVNWLLNEDITAETRKKLVEDIRRHCPEVFGEKSYKENKLIIPGSQAEAKIAQQFVYYCSGESAAYGVDAERMVNFYPFVVSANSAGIETLKTPWGTEYNLDSGRPVSLFIRDASDTLVEVLSTDEYKDYFDILKNRPKMKDLTKEQTEESKRLYAELASLTDEIYSIDSIVEYLNQYIGVEQDVSQLKHDVLNDITPEVKEKMLRAMQLSLGLQNVPYSEFINMKIPVIRIQTNTISKDNNVFSSFTAVDFEHIKKLNTLINNVHVRSQNTVLVVGTITPKEILGYIPNEFNETLISENTANSFKRYKIHFDYIKKRPKDRFERRDVSTASEIDASFSILKVITDIVQEYDYIIPTYNYNLYLDISNTVINDMKIFSVLNYSKEQFESLFNVSYDEYDSFVSDVALEQRRRSIGLKSDQMQKFHSKFNYYSEALKIDALNSIYRIYGFNMPFSEFINSEIFICRDTSLPHSEGVSTALIVDNTLTAEMLNNISLQDGVNRVDIFKVAVKDILAFIESDVYVDDTALQLVESFNVENYTEDGKFISTTDYQPHTSLGETEEDVIDRTTFKSMADTTKKKRKKEKSDEDDTRQKRQYKVMTGAKGLDRIYVSQAMGKGTALEKYGYTGKYKRTYMSKGTYDFIRRFDETLLFKNEDGKLGDADERLLTALKSGKATSSDILDYFRDAEHMTDKMFDLINDSFFKNKFITTFNDLQKRVLESGQYYALRTIMRIAKLDDKFIENADEDLFMHAVMLMSRLKGKVIYNGKTVNLNELFDKISTRYNNNDFVYSERLLRRLWMQYYDGTAATGGYIAGIARWAAFASVNITGEGASRVRRSTNETVGDSDLTMEDVVADTNDDFAQLFNNMSTAQKIQQIQVMLSLQSGIDFENVDKMDDKKRKKFVQWFHSIGVKLEEMSDENIEKYYEKQYRKLTDTQRQVIMRMSLALEAGNITYAQLKEKEAAKLQNIATTSEAKMSRPSSAIVASMRGLLRTIKNNVGQNVYKRILKDNSDILDSKLNLKTDDMKEVVNNRTVYKSPETLEPILERIRAIVQDVKDGAYESSKATKAKDKMRRELEKLKAENEKLKARRGKEGKTRVVRYDVNDDSIEIHTSKQIPTALKRILDNTFTQSAETTVKFLSEQEAKGKSEQQKERHIKMNLESFIKDNAEILLMLTQADVDEIIDFYLHSEVIPTTNKARQYVATRIYLLGYLLTNKLEAGQHSINTVGTAEWTLSSEQRETLTDYLENVNVSIPAAMLSAWKATMHSFDPSRIILKNIADRVNIEFTNEEIDNLVDAVQSNDPERIKTAQHEMYSNGLKRYVQTNKTLTFDAFLNKVINFERMCMLSGPGTWIRNWTSNIIVQGGNWASGKIGSLVASVFPKKWKRDGQYNIVNTKVDAATKKFVTEQVVNSGLLNLLGDSLSKYDTRKSKRASVSADESIIELLKESVRSRILYDNGYNNKILDLVNRGLGKLLSDNHWINKQTIYYLSRTLIEDNVDLSEGLSKQVIEHLADAYRMAAQDYMHKSNIFNAIESKIYEKLGTKGYFVYKQILPFASAGWNWFVEGLNYTPIGLVKSIVQYAKLENTITKLEDAEQKGHFEGIPTKFAQYKSIRNLGKGVLGTIGCIAGILLAACGIAGIDEEDEKYKLHVGDVYVDISSLFGTQGILMGITVTSAIVNSIQKSKDGQDVNVGDELWSIFKTALDATFADSTLDDIVGTFRYSSSVGDWLSDMPFTIVGMMVPNFLKQLLSFAPTNSVQYDKGILGKLEKMVVQNLPVLVYAFPKQVDPYTGETQVPYVANSFIKMLNKFMPIDIAPYRFSDIEKEALSLGLKKGQLTGNYDIDGQKIKLKSSEVHTANTYYGKLNKKDLEAFTKNKTSYKVWDERKNKYVTLKYSQMTDKQKASVIDRIMSNNASLAKIYILTSTGKYKYFADESEYKDLRKAGITKNVYKATETKSGFVK